MIFIWFYEVYIIQANTNPYLGTPNEKMKILVKKMLDDMLQVIVDPIYNP